MLQVDLSDAQGDAEALAELGRLEQDAADAAAAASAMPAGEELAAPGQNATKADHAERQAA